MRQINQTIAVNVTLKNIFAISFNGRFIGNGTLLQIPELITPGCKQLAVTPTKKNLIKTRFFFNTGKMLTVQNSLEFKLIVSLKVK